MHLFADSTTGQDKGKRMGEPTEPPQLQSPPMTMALRTGSTIATTLPDVKNSPSKKRPSKSTTVNVESLSLSPDGVRGDERHADRRRHSGSSDDENETDSNIARGRSNRSCGRKSMWSISFCLAMGIGVVLVNSPGSQEVMVPVLTETAPRANLDGDKDTLPRNNTAVVAKLPFFEKEGHGPKGDAQAPAKPRWVQVLSSKAAHPAMYVPGDGLVYCPIAKVACAEWRKTLRWMLGIPNWDTGPIHEQGKNGIPLLAGKKAKEVELVMNDDSWLKFVVVRDPADRLLSAFLNKCVGGEWSNCPYVDFMPDRFDGVVTRTGETDKVLFQAIREEPRNVFRDFLMGVRRDVRVKGCRVNSHWRPQHCFCSLSRFMSSYHVVPFSNMSTEAVALVDRMSRPSPERADLLREFYLNRFSQNYDAKAQGAETKRDRFFSQEALLIVKQVYGKDYQLFHQYFEEHEAPPL